jgi:hypothetical protein
MDFKVVDACVSVDSYQIQFNKRVKFDLKKAANAVEKMGQVLGETKVVLFSKIEGFGVSIYEDGRIIMKNIEKEEAENLARKIVDTLENAEAFL